MSLAGRARRVAAQAAFGGGGAVGVAGGAIGVLWAQSLIARRRVGDSLAEPFTVDGRYGRGSGRPIGLAMLGDSSAAGLGADEPGDTVAVVLARGLAEESGRPVELVNLAVVGAQTAAVPAQVETALFAFDGSGPELAVIMVGANDVTHRVRNTVSLRHLDQVVRRLTETGCSVVVACCPDLGTVQPVPNPLRALARRWSRTLAAAQAITAVEAGASAVSLGSLLGPDFSARPQEYFSADGFHPSSLGYRRVGEVLLPTACAALGLRTSVGDPLDPSRGERVAPLSEVAATAAVHGGTEVTASSVAGEDRGVQGRWAALRHRIPLLRPDTDHEVAVDAEGDAEGDVEVDDELPSEPAPAPE
jgi:lysophospholipase L1-like esterase